MGKLKEMDVFLNCALWSVLIVPLVHGDRQSCKQHRNFQTCRLFVSAMSFTIITFSDMQIFLTVSYFKTHSLWRWQHMTT